MNKFENFTDNEKLSINQFMNWISKIDKSNLSDDCGGSGPTYIEDKNYKFRNVSLDDMIVSICLLNNVPMTNARWKIIPFAREKSYWRTDAFAYTIFGVLSREEYDQLKLTNIKLHAD
jgi:hypothetical protein